MTDGTTFWMERYYAVVNEKKALGDKLRETLEENEDLQEQLDKLKDRLTYSALKNMETEISHLKETLDAADSEKKELQQKINELRSSNEVIRSINSSMSRSLSSSMHQAQDLKTQLEKMKEENESLHNVVDSFVDKCKEVEDKAVQDRFTKADLEAQLKDMTQRYENTSLSNRIYKERLDKSIADRKELQAEIEELKKKIESLTTDLEFAEKAERQLEEKKQQSYSEGYSDGNEEGQNELWEMLQLINDVKPFEAPYFEDVTSMNDIISWDLEDFNEAYSKWEEEKKNVDHMRSYLKNYCVGKLCFDCPLYNASEPVSSCLFSKLPDEEIEKRYRKAVDSEYKKTRVPVSARLPQHWECTIEAKVEINEDLLEKVCGVKTEETEEHKLEYGDAVRVPWSDYDYMYIGPEEKHIRLFNPKTHTVVFVAPNENLKYHGCKIVITDEEDLRKIWKYMK